MYIHYFWRMIVVAICPAASFIKMVTTFPVVCLEPTCKSHTCGQWISNHSSWHTCLMSTPSLYIMPARARVYAWISMNGKWKIEPVGRWDTVMVSEVEAGQHFLFCRLKQLVDKQSQRIIHEGHGNFKLDLGKTCFLEAILAKTLGSDFKLTRSFALSEWVEVEKSKQSYFKHWLTFP